MSKLDHEWETRAREAEGENDFLVERSWQQINNAVTGSWWEGVMVGMSIIIGAGALYFLGMAFVDNLNFEGIMKLH